MALLLAWPCVTGAAAQSVAVIVPPAGAAREGWQALEDGRYRDAETAFARAISEKPDDPALLLGSGIVARRLGQTAKAEGAFVRALQIDPALTPASLLLGMMHYEAGDVDAALRVYEAALVRAPTHPQLLARVAEWRKEAALHSGFLKNQAGHFTVLFEGPAAADVAGAAIDILEREYYRVGDLLQVYPSKPVTVVLYTAQQFSDITRTPGWSGGLYDGRIRIPTRGGLQNRKELERVLAHEYVHAALHSMAPGGVPAWINEGLAAALEPGGPGRADRDLADARELIPLDRLRGSFGALPAERVKLAYAESATAVQGIIDRVGVPALIALAVDLSSGEDFERAFETRVQLPFDEFQRQFQASWRVR